MSFMPYRPLGLNVIVFCHVLAPIFNVLVAALFLGIPPSIYLSNLFHSSWSVQAEFFLLYPLAGWAIYRVRPWSYPVYLLCIGWAMFRHWQNARYYPHILSQGLPWVFFGVNLLIVAYFVRRGVRGPFFNARLRWWETQTRFPVRIPCRIGARTQEIRDFSVGGVLIELEESSLTVGQEVQVVFEFFDYRFELLGQVMHERSGERAGTRQVGVRWIAADWRTFARLRDVAYGLQYLGVPSKRGKRLGIRQAVIEEWNGILSDLRFKGPRKSPAG